jgi:hypothetical protein
LPNTVLSLVVVVVVVDVDVDVVSGSRRGWLFSDQRGPVQAGPPPTPHCCFAAKVTDLFIDLIDC